MFKTPLAKAAPAALSLQVNSSAYGMCVPIIIGRTKCSPRLIWDGNFKSHNASGKKGKSGKKGGGMKTYSVDADMLLGTMGFGRTRANQNTNQALQSLLAIWANKDKYAVNIGSCTAVVTAGSISIAGQVPGGDSNLIVALAITVPTAYSVTFNDYGGPGSQSFSGSYPKNLWNSAFYYYDQNLATPQAGTLKHPYYTQAASVAASTTIAVDTTLNGQTVTVWFAYATSAVERPLTKINQTFESNLGSAGLQPVTYTDCGGVAGTNIDCGATNSLPNFNYEVVGWGGVSPYGDANPADAIDLILMGPHGMNAAQFLQQSNGPLAILGDLSSLRAYCDALGIWISASFDQQRSGSDLLGDLFDIANCAPLWSEGVLKAIPWCEVSIVPSSQSVNQVEQYVVPSAGPYTVTVQFAANYTADVGVSYTGGAALAKVGGAPAKGQYSVNTSTGVYTFNSGDYGQPITITYSYGFSGAGTFTSPTASGPVVNLGPQDFICKKGEPPIKITRTTQKDAKNILPIEFSDRSNDYNRGSIECQEAQSVSEWGPVRDSVKRLDSVHDARTANLVGSVMVKRGAMRAKALIEFTLSPRHLRLEPVDLATLTDPISGLSLYPVRLLTANVQPDMSIECSAEPFLYGANSPVSPGGVSANGQSPNPQARYSNVPPGAVNSPIFIEAVPRLYGTVGSAELWIVASSSSPNYGGCEVFLSVDGGASYNSLGSISGNAVTGTTVTSPWPAANDPDTTNDLDVDLTESNGALVNWPSSAADQFVPVCYVEGGNATIPYELIAYTTAQLTATSKYKLKATGAGNEIRRAVFNAPAQGAGVSHTTGKRFAYLAAEAPGILKVELDPLWVGKVLHFKFCAVNVYGTQEQSLSTATDYTFTPTGTVGTTGANPNTNYAITPANPLSQAASTYTVVMAQCSANFASGTANYNGRSFSVSDPGVGNTQQYWVTVADPQYIGDTGALTNLSAYCETNQTKWNTPGYTRIGTIIVTHTGVITGGGGGNTPGSSLLKLTVSGTINGSNVTFTLSSPVATLLLFWNGQLVSPSDYTFSGSGFVCTGFTPQTGDQLNAYGM